MAAAHGANSQPPAAPAAASAPPAAASKPAAEDNHFDIFEYRVLGNTVLTNREIESVVYPLLGERKTLADVEIARAALEKAYHDKGFSTVFVDIPEQTVAEKIVRLKVTEGRFSSVRLSGARYFSERQIIARIPMAKSGAVPNVTELQRQLTAVNVQTADRAIVPVLKAGQSPGSVDLSLKVEDHLPLHGGITLNNQYTPQTKPLRATADISYSNLFGELDSISAQVQLSPQDTSEVKVFAANYAWGSLRNGLRPSVYFIDSDSNVAVVGTLGVLGKGKIWGGRISVPITDDIGMPQSLTFGIDYKRFRETIGIKGSSNLVTPISYTNLSIGYSGFWNSPGFQETLGLTANFGPRGLPNTSDDFAGKRYRGQANYFYLKLSGSMTAQLPKDFSVTLRADGQFAWEPLITNENFALTGSDGVRGYLEAEVLGDTGIKGSLQVQSPTWHWGETPLVNGFAFFDAGRIDYVNPLPSDPSSAVLRSWGVGLSLLPGKSVTGSVTWADPLVNGPNTRRGSGRVLFNVRGGF